MFLAIHLIFFETVSRALARLFAPAPASGYFLKKAFISSNFVCVAKDRVMAGIRLPRYRSFSVYLSTRNSQLSRTQFHTSDVPSGLPEIDIKQFKKSWERTFSVLVALVMKLKRKQIFDYQFSILDSRFRVGERERGTTATLRQFVILSEPRKKSAYSVY